MRKLLILVPTLMLGGQERVAAKTADLMSKKYDVTLAVFDISNAVYSTSCNTINLNIPSKPGKLNKIINVAKRVKVVKTLRKQLQTDYVYSFGTTANLVNVLSKGIGKTIIGLRGFQSITSSGRIDQYVLRHADTIICNSKEMCNVVITRTPSCDKKTRYLYNPSDVDSILKQSEENVLDYTFSPCTIVSHGRLDEVKNWPRLIKAFSIIKKEVQDAQLLIIGEGEQRHSLESLITNYHLQDSVTLLGFRSNPFAYIARSSIYVLPSYSEGFPNALVEGMVFLPAISVDCKSGPREILSSGNVDSVTTGYEVCDYGVLVQPASDRKYYEEITYDDEILADAVLKVLRNRELADQLKLAAQQRAAEFSCDRYTNELIGILEKMA